MSSMTPTEARAAFKKLFQSLAPEKHRYVVFKDFVTASAIALYNVLARDEKYENEYLTIEAQYKKGDKHPLAELFGLLTLSYDETPSDVLGELFMEFDLGNDRTSQFFTPFHISELMAGIGYGGELQTLSKPFISLSEPTCGAGGMVLAFAKVMMSYDHSPHERLWVQAQDIDRLAAMMCFIQLSLWHIPAIVIVGDTLKLEAKEVFHTAAYVLGGWDEKIKQWERVEMMRRLVCGEFVANREATAEDKSVDSPVASNEPPKPVSQTPMQFDFEF